MLLVKLVAVFWTLWYDEHVLPIEHGARIVEILNREPPRLLPLDCSVGFKLSDIGITDAFARQLEADI